ncbi:MAG: hypothetical protein AB7U20_07585 [Planctomycetaceae bacterium]
MPLDAGVAVPARSMPNPDHARHSGRSMSFWLAAAACVATNVSFAQDLRVLTRISLQLPQDGRWQPLSRSLTLFHGGKVYDHVEEIGEVVIHEPRESQFVILSLTGNKMASRVRYEELVRFLEMFSAETAKYLEELNSAPGQNYGNAIQALAFQLQPQFAESFEPSTGQLRLSSRFVIYQAETASFGRPDVVNQYLEWADWTARLNYMLNPQPVTPESRIELNQALRTQQRLPTQVDLTLLIDGESRLKAEHTFDERLRSLDRDFIAKWEKARNAKDLRWVPLREYQQIITASNRRGR